MISSRSRKTVIIEKKYGEKLDVDHELTPLTQNGQNEEYNDRDANLDLRVISSEEIKFCILDHARPTIDHEIAAPT